MIYLGNFIARINVTSNRMNGERGLTTLYAQSKSPDEIKAAADFTALRGKTDDVMARRLQGRPG